MLDDLKNRMKAIGYAWKNGDEALAASALDKAVNTIKNECNIPDVPEGLKGIAADMAAGEFLMVKKAFSPEALENLNLEAAVKQIQAGDTNTVFAVGEGCKTPEQRLDALISYLLSGGKEELSAYRRVRW